jgi:23S rRNA (adenine2030-N6)-methyltransferase
MNYRHAYHAGNFADVLKHVLLVRSIEYLKRKDAPFRVVDTHAGSGCYQLTSAEAEKTGEWREGIGRLLGSDVPSLPAKVAQYLAPYLDAVRAQNPGALTYYPGSPRLALHLLRAQDTLVANELHPDEFTQLKAALARDARARITALDGWVAIKSLLPPKERRGIILIDPPFEEEGELERLVQGLRHGVERFASGVFLLWYPIKDPAPIRHFHKALAGLGLQNLLVVELMLRPVRDRERLNGCGVIVANPPYTLEAELGAILPELRRLLGDRKSASYRLDRLAPKAT